MIRVDIDPASAEAALNSSLFQGAGGIANAIPGLGAKSTVEAFALSKIRDGLAQNGIQAQVDQVPDAPADYYASRGLALVVGVVVGAVAGALLKG